MFHGFRFVHLIQHGQNPLAETDIKIAYGNQISVLYVFWLPDFFTVQKSTVQTAIVRQQVCAIFSRNDGMPPGNIVSLQPQVTLHSPADHSPFFFLHIQRLGAFHVSAQNIDSNLFLLIQNKNIAVLDFTFGFQDTHILTVREPFSVPFI